MRSSYELTDIEFAKFKRLQPYQGEAVSFWKWVAKARNLDPKSLITNGKTFTGLPKDHKLPWCFPMQLKCKKKPVYAD